MKTLKFAISNRFEAKKGQIKDNQYESLSKSLHLKGSNHPLILHSSEYVEVRKSYMEQSKIIITGTSLQV